MLAVETLFVHNSCAWRSDLRSNKIVVTKVEPIRHDKCQQPKTHCLDVSQASIQQEVPKISGTAPWAPNGHGYTERRRPNEMHETCSNQSKHKEYVFCSACSSLILRLKIYPNNIKNRIELNQTKEKPDILKMLYANWQECRSTNYMTLHGI